jgi:cytidylate kinase
VAVIAISRGFFFGAQLLAERLAGKLGYRCIDRDVIVAKASACGVSQEELRNALDNPPSFFERFHRRKTMYMRVYQSLLLDEVRSGNVIYNSNAGHFLLGNISHVLKARIIAPLEFRLAMVQERMHKSRPEALAYIQKFDQERAKWTRFIYGVDWTDPSYYDLVINLERMDVRDATEVILASVRLKCFQETEESRAAMENLALESRVKARLVTHPPTSQLEMEVLARGGLVRLRGSLYSQKQVVEVRNLVLAVPGVEELEEEIDVVDAEV